MDITKTKVIVATTVIVTAFAAGRYSVRSPQVKTTEVATEQTRIAESKDMHTKTTIVETKKPDGTDTKTTVIDQVTNDVKAESDVRHVDYSQVVTPPKTETLNISILATSDFKSISPVYGLAVSKEILGPIRIGAFGLMNGVVGVSLGLDF